MVEPGWSKTIDKDETPTPWTRGDDKRLVRDVTYEAGRIALDFFSREIAVWEKSPGHPVCEADIAVDTFLRTTLLQNRTGYGWLSEETKDQPERLRMGRIWIVDPIDGTRAFLRGDDDWGISVALVENSTPVVAAFYAPVRDSFYLAVAGEGTTRNGYPITCLPCEGLDQAHMMGSPDAFRDTRTWPCPWPDSMTSEKANSIALRMCSVAAGEADCCVTLRPKCDWDVAAADLIVREAGGIVLTGQSKALIFNTKIPLFDHIIACEPSLEEPIMQRVTLALEAWSAKGLKP